MAHDAYPVEFVWAGIPYNSDIYWIDQNGDGRVSENEHLQIPDGGLWQKNADEYIKAHPEFFSENIQWQAKRFNSRAEYFDHPEKTSLKLQLLIDIAKLKRMANRPGIYSDLLRDLYFIQDELQYTKFRYAKPEEVPQGFLALYNPLNSTMSLSYNTPTALLIHEMDHALTTHRRTDRAVLDQYPNYDKNLVTGFEFYLDYPLDEAPKFYYDALQAYDPLLNSPDPEKALCLNDANKKAALANEVQAYLTMCRYLLFQMEVSDQDLKTIRRGGSEAKKFLSSLQTKLEKLLGGSNLNPAWVNEMLLHYFAKAGFWGSSDLADFVDEYYSHQKAPGFVDTDACIERPRASRACGFSFGN